MDFFRAQAKARSQSRLLTFAFAACVLAVVAVLDVVALAVLRIVLAMSEQPQPLYGSLAEWMGHHPAAVLVTGLLVAGFIGTASLTRMLQLARGGGYVARSLGGVRVEPGTPDPRRRLLHNVVEEMAIASGVPVPEVYVLEEEEGINAFAAGFSPAQAAVAVTRGALTHLSRDQLQGIIAHEFSHILNGDMRLSTRLVGLIFGLMAVAIAGRLLLRAGASGRRGAPPVMALGLAVVVVGQVGFWAGRLLQAWISRTRESLADHSAVQFTRQPVGLRDALVRAAALGRHGRYADPAFEEVAHMLFMPAFRRALATHPPLLERVRALDPHVNQAQLDSMLRRAREQVAQEREALLAAQPPAEEGPIARDGYGRPGPGAIGAAVPAAAALIAATAGDPAPRHLDHAIALRRALPAGLRASADRPEQAQALLLALVVYADSGGHAARLAFVREKFGEAMAAAVQGAAGSASGLAPLLRLPAVLQLIPALRALSASERMLYVDGLRELMRADGSLSVFEYALEKLAIRALTPDAARREPHGRGSLADSEEALGVVFAVLARHGARDAEQARRAYEAGLSMLLPRRRPAYAVIDAWVPLFDKALDELTRLRVAAKQLLVAALVRTIAHDELLTSAEAELLRAICGVLECPLPPVLPEIGTPVHDAGFGNESRGADR